uniref:Uncharacterized protein n=1 Tax=Cacopsylla melanoneura TaxID=428564 RepID=A0A8D8XAJ9_9HEMI
MESSAGPAGESRGTDGNESQTVGQRCKGDQFVAFLREHPCAPLANVSLTRHWTTSKWRFEPTNSNIVSADLTGTYDRLNYKLVTEQQNFIYCVPNYLCSIFCTSVFMKFMYQCFMYCKLGLSR